VNAVWITNIPRALSKQRIACGSPMGAQKQFPDVIELLCSETSGPPSSGEGQRGLCASTRRGFQMRCAGKCFRGQLFVSGDVILSYLHWNLHTLRERLKVSRSQG
jgi:hypothetical protein